VLIPGVKSGDPGFKELILESRICEGNVTQTNAKVFEIPISIQYTAWNKTEFNMYPL
jgi:hypothetical protein